jgi:hypothetical protein
MTVTLSSVVPETNQDDRQGLALIDARTAPVEAEELVRGSRRRVSRGRGEDPKQRGGTRQMIQGSCDQKQSGLKEVPIGLAKS